MTTLLDPTSSAAEAPARTCPLPEKEQAFPVLDPGCSITLLGLLGAFDPGGLFGRTSGVLFPLTEDEILSQCSGSSLASGTMRNGHVYAQATRVCPTAESGCSSWPTCRASDERGNAWMFRRNNLMLTGVAQNWPTPDANCHKGSAKIGQRRCQLDEAAEQIWQTPATDSFRSRGGARKHEKGLDQQARLALWATPRAITGGAESTQRKRDLGRTRSGGGDLQAQAIESVGPTSSPKPRGSRPRLNPVFVEWLMGFPLWWTLFGAPDSEPSETPSSPPAPAG